MNYNNDINNTIVAAAGLQKALGHAQRSVVRCRLDLQQFAHQRVNVDTVKWLRQEVLFKVWSKGPEDGLHVHLSVVVAVIPFVDVDNKSLEVKSLIRSHVSS